MAPLNGKQKMFGKEYIIDLNATQAAIRAGYSVKTAYSQGQRLLKKVELQAFIQSQMDKRSSRVEITADNVLKELALMGFANMLDYITVNDDGSAYVDLKNVTREQAAALSEVVVDQYVEGNGEDAKPVKKIKIKLADKKSNLELIGRHLKLFTDKLEVGGKDGGPVEVSMSPTEAYRMLKDGS